MELPDRAAAVDRVLDLSLAPTDAMPLPPYTFENQWQAWLDATHWWLERMRTTPVPIIEKLTLFWHGHFTSSFEKTPVMRPLVEQNQLYRDHALGDFHALAQQVAVDPAMLHYLDNWLNLVGAPQENFSRELMELFTLGRANHSQADVVAMARAWSGHSIETSDLSYLYRSYWHDGGQKKLFGRPARDWSGPEALTEVIKGSMAVPSSKFIASKLFSHLGYPVTPSDEVVAPLAAAFRAANWDILSLVKAIFMSDAFWGQEARHALLRSPIEFFVAALQAVDVPTTKALPQWWSWMVGQVLFAPPNVSGWGANEAWLGVGSLWGRQGFAANLRWLATEKGVLASTGLCPTADAVEQAFTQFGIVEPSPATRAALEAYVERARAEGDAWAVQPNLIMLTMLAPDFQVA